ncbi:MAG: UDP-glucose/GDP-mannose dehydrogenase family protein [Actinomycetia bacterium]|nr:UDP-glucose/GDP-mannose dehydrogenase family protein [Actinomycetes bacterium]
MKVSVIGTGYVGLVTGVCLAEIGNDVICVDKIDDKVDTLKKGKSPIYEPGLENLIKKNLEAERLFFTTSIPEAVAESDIIFISVGTPSLPNGQADLSYVEQVAIDIGKFINGKKIVVNKSTVPIGSGDWVSMIISESIEANNTNKNVSFEVVSNPEFLREGSAVEDTFFPDRIIVGSSSKQAIERMLGLYRPLIEQDFDWPEDERLIPEGQKVPVVVTDLTSAEMIKYASNSFLATKISFINEMANICEKVGADVTHVAKGMGLDKRIGPQFLKAGIGWGGSCFPKDVSALAYIAGEHGITPQILNSIINVNKEQRLKIIQKVQDELKDVNGKTVSVLGISFKPNTDDTRDAPGISIMNSLCKLGAKVRAYDPIVKDRPVLLNEKIEICADKYDALEKADVLILATEWDEFVQIDFDRVKKLMNNHLIIDGRNIFDRKNLEKQGFKYFGIGR